MSKTILTPAECAEIGERCVRVSKILHTHAETDTPRLLDTVEALRSAWQPIETAPKDGTDVLLHNNHAPGLPSGHPDRCSGINTVVGAWWGEENGGDGAWICYMDAVEDPECPFDPTHWQPLPEPPKEET